MNLTSYGIFLQHLSSESNKYFYNHEVAAVFVGTHFKNTHFGILLQKIARLIIFTNKQKV